MRRMMALMLMLGFALSLTGCASTIEHAKAAAKEALAEVGPVLKEAGADLLAEGRAQAALLAKDLATQAMKAWIENKGDFQATLKATLATIPGLAAEAGQKAAGEALAKRIEALEGKPKADEFRQRAADDGLQSALGWASGGTGAVGLGLYLMRLLKQRAALSNALASAPPDVRAQVLANAAAHPIVERVAGGAS